MKQKYREVENTLFPPGFSYDILLSIPVSSEESLVFLDFLLSVILMRNKIFFYS